MTAPPDLPVPTGVHLRLERDGDAEGILALLEEGFGPDRFRKTVYRLREGVAPIPDLCLVAEEEDGTLRGTLRFWPVRFGQETVLLLGPIAVMGGLRKTGVGTLLMREGLARAKAQGWKAVLLVGDPSYYTRFGFRRDLALGVDLPGPVEAERVLGLEFEEGTLLNRQGLLSAAPTVVAPKGKSLLLGMAVAMLLALSPLSPAEASRGWSCVPYARSVSTIDLQGDAWRWWDAAAGQYQRGRQPVPGAVMVFERTSSLRRGHVAVVRAVESSRKILIDHANWGTGAGKGRVDQAVAVVDVSRNNDWSVVRVWYSPINDYGTTDYPTRGFIYPQGGEPELSVAMAPLPLPKPVRMSQLAQSDDE